MKRPVFYALILLIIGLFSCEKLDHDVAPLAIGQEKTSTAPFISTKSRKAAPPPIMQLINPTINHSSYSLPAGTGPGNSYQITLEVAPNLIGIPASSLTYNWVLWSQGLMSFSPPEDVTANPAFTLIGSNGGQTMSIIYTLTGTALFNGAFTAMCEIYQPADPPGSPSARVSAIVSCEDIPEQTLGIRLGLITFNSTITQGVFPSSISQTSTGTLELFTGGGSFANFGSAYYDTQGDGYGTGLDVATFQGLSTTISYPGAGPFTNKHLNLYTGLDPQEPVYSPFWWTYFSQHNYLHF